MIISILSIIVFLIIISILRFKKINKKIFLKKSEEKAIVGNSIKRKGEVSAKNGMLFRVRYLEKKEKDINYLEKGDSLTEIRDYGLFKVKTKLSFLQEYTIYTLSHTHIIDVEISFECKSPSRIYINGNGYIVNFANGDRYGILLLGAKRVRISQNGLLIKVKDSCVIATKKDQVPLISDIKKGWAREFQPFLIKTKDSLLDGLFNYWLWDSVKGCVKKNFESGVLCASIKLLYGDRSPIDFLINSFVERNDSIDKSICIHLICDYIESQEISFYTLAQKKMLRIRINEYIFEESEKKMTNAEQLLRLSALTRMATFLNVDDKIKTLKVIERERKRENVQSEDILLANKKYLFLYFGKNHKLAKSFYTKSVNEIIDEIQKINPLYTGKKLDFVTSSMIYYYLLNVVFGIRCVKGKFSFKPNFPNNWKRVKIFINKGDRQTEVELVSSDYNAIRIDGVDYGGDLVGILGDKQRKYSIYFK